MLEYRVPGRLFVLFCAIYCASSVWELNWGVNYMLSLFSASEQDYASLCRCRGFDLFMEIRIFWSEASCLPADLFSISTI